MRISISSSRCLSFTPAGRIRELCDGTLTGINASACADLATLWQLPIVKDKTRLNILVMLTPQFHNIGPHHFDPMYIWPYKGLIVSTDPVAADAVGLRIIQQKRLEVFGQERPLQPTAHHIRLPLLILQGTGDLIVDPKGGQLLHDRAATSDKTLRLYKGLYHDLVHEPERQQVRADLIEWLNDRC